MTYAKRSIILRSNASTSLLPCGEGTCVIIPRPGVVAEPRKKGALFNQPPPLLYSISAFTLVSMPHTPLLSLHARSGPKRTLGLLMQGVVVHHASEEQGAVSALPCAR